MKKSILNLSFIAILTILFSSCGSISITQKRYSNGLNIDWFAAKDKKQDNQPVVKTRKAKSNPSNTIASINENESTVEADLNETIVIENIEVSNSFSETQHPYNAASKNKQTHKKTLKFLENNTKEDVGILENNKPKNIKRNVVKSLKNSSTNDSGLPLILLVIIALIIPPLAVYLYYGEINIQFWINLILLLLFGGLYSSIGLIGIGIAVIHALLVVFGLFS